MIVYEVNIDVAPAIEDAYYEWLLVHCREMTHQIEGMRNFTICERDAAADSPGWKKGYTVSYFIETREALDDYIANRAAVMRQQAVDTFGADQFKGTRRIDRRGRIFGKKKKNLNVSSVYSTGRLC